MATDAKKVRVLLTPTRDTPIERRLQRVGTAARAAVQVRDVAIGEAAKAGWSMRRIAAAVGLSPSRVHAIVRERGGL